MARTAVEIVRRYGIDAWSQGRDDWIPELCADPIIRHDANREVRLSHAEQRARMRHNYEELRPTFEPIVLAGDDEYVTLVWNVTGRDPNWKLCGIEIFRVLGGKIVEVWNSTYMDGRWGLSKTLGARIGNGGSTALALVQADVAEQDGRIAGRLLVPAETRGLTLWLMQVLGPPATEPVGERWRHRFGGGTAPSLALTLTDHGEPPLGIGNIAVSALSMSLERSGLVNAEVVLTGEPAAPIDGGPFRAATPTRLADVFGSFVQGDRSGKVADAMIELVPGGTASGRVTLCLADPTAVTGEGVLSFGWREGARELRFTGRATLSSPTGRFDDDGVSQVSFAWHGSAFVAEILDERATFEDI